MEHYEKLNAFVQQGRLKNVQDEVTAALSAGASPKEILDEGLLPAMAIVGDKFKAGEVYVPEVMMAARAMTAGIELLKPHLAAGDMEKKGRAVLGTVKGDMHDIGKNLVKIMMEGRGIEVIDLGVDVSAEKFIETAVKEDAGIVACSALLTTTMSVMERVVQTVEEQGLHDKIKVMVGGAPVTQEFCDSIGADAYAPDAASASDAALILLSGGST